MIVGWIWHDLEIASGDFGMNLGWFGDDSGINLGWFLDDLGQNDTHQVWILNSIGKYKPITAAFSIQNCSVKSAHVLVYREQHGYEIKYPFFLTQFTDAKIDSALKLDTKIDNISAATLSVNSMKRMAKMALLLSKLSNENSCT